jgi:hypothetical protein
MSVQQQVDDEFKRRFNAPPQIVVRAPGVKELQVLTRAN